MSVFSDRVRIERDNLKLNKQELADRVGVARTTVISWESGEHEPGVTTLARLCRLFGMSADELIGLEPLPDKIFEGKNGLCWRVVRENCTQPELQDDLKEGIELFEQIANGEFHREKYARSDQELQQLLRLVLFSRVVQLTSVESATDIEGKLQEKFKKVGLKGCLVTNTPFLNNPGVDEPIRTEVVAFLAAKECVPTLKSVDTVGLTGGGPIARFVDLLPAFSPQLAGKKWYSLLSAASENDASPKGTTANSIVGTLPYRQASSEGIILPFVDLPQRKKQSAGADDESEAAQVIVQEAREISAAFLTVGTKPTDWSKNARPSDAKKLNRALREIHDKNLDGDLAGDILLRFLNDKGEALLPEESSELNEAFVYSIKLQDLHDMASGNPKYNRQPIPVWVLCEHFEAVRIVRAVITAGYANRLVIEHGLARALLH